MEPICGGRSPIALELQPGTYWWCVCGRSKTQPFCDNSHQGTGIEPLEVTLEAPRRISFCTCKMTTRPPFCDGTHKRLPPLPEEAPAVSPPGMAP